MRLTFHPDRWASCTLSGCDVWVTLVPGVKEPPAIILPPLPGSPEAEPIAQSIWKRP